MNGTIIPTTPLYPGLVTGGFEAHFEELDVMQAALYSARPEEIPGLYGEICDRVTAQAGVYERRVLSLSGEIDAIKAKDAVAKGDGERLLEFVELRNAVFRSFQRDVAFLDGLMENWHVRRIAAAHANLRRTEERYFNLENNPIKAVPMYAVNFSNSVCTLMGALLMLSAFNTGLPYLLHDTFPDLIPKVADPHAHIKLDALTDFLKQITVFGLCFDAVYAGAKGMRCRNTNWIGARAWNTILDTVGLPFRAAEPATRLISGALHSVIGRPWEVATRYAYRLTRLGALGVVRQIGRDLTVSPNGAATWLVRKVRSDAPELRPFGRVGDISAGMMIGTVFDWSVGVFENVMQNIIVGAHGATLSEKVGASLANPFALAWQNAAPTAACNLMHANATARVSQYPGNDDIQVVWSRFFLGVIKGSLLTALITTSAINNEAAAATAVILGAQVLIGGNSIAMSQFLTNQGLRAKAATLFVRIKNRISRIWKSLFAPNRP